MRPVRAGTTWTGGGSDASWGTVNNWGGALPPFNGTQAITLGSAFTSGSTMTLDGNRNIGSLIIGTTTAFTLATGSSGSLDIFSGNITRQATSANLQILSANVILGDLANAAAYTGAWNIAGAGSLSVTGAISEAGGSRGITLTGGGTVTLGGATANTYTGATTVNQGTLILGKTAGVKAFGGPLVIGGAGSAATVQLNASNQINSAAVTVNALGQLNLNNNSDTLGTLTLTGGTIATGTGTLTFNGNVTTNASNVSSLISGLAVIPGSGTVTVAIGTTPSGYDLVVSADVSGAFGFDKLGAGKLLLSGNNTFTGGFIIDDGTVAVTSLASLGSTTGGLTINAGTLEIVNGFSTPRTITLGNTASTFQIDPAQTYTVTSPIGGTGTLNKAGGGTLVLTAANTYNGGTAINAGSIVVNSSSSLGAFTATTGGLTINAGTLEVATGYTTSRVITLGNAASTFQIDPAQTFNVTSIIGGTGALNKTGTGTIQLSGANTYSGGTVINAGTVEANSSASLGAANAVATINAGTLDVSASYSSARNFVLGNSASTIMVDPAQTFTIGNVVSGSGNLNKSGTGTLVLSGVDTYSGGTFVTAGTLSLGAGASLASTVLNVSSGATFNGNATATLPNTIAVTANGNVNFNAATRTVASLDGANTGVVTLNGTNLTSSGGSYAGVIQNGASSGSITKAGSGTWTLTGANTFTGTTTVNAGTLTVAATTGSALGATSAITVNSGGTLLLGASNQINNTAGVTLAGGTFAKGNFSEGSASVTNTPGVGALTLTASGSHLDFGTGTTGALTSASFAPGAFTLTIDNWTGTANTLGTSTTDRLIFSGDQTANLASFAFTGYIGATEYQIGTSGFYEIVPLTAVPEPSTYAAAALAALGIAYQQRRRLRRVFQL